MPGCLAHVKQQLRPDEKLILLTDTDIERDGRFGCRWLAVTSERVMTFADDGQFDGPEVAVPLKEVRSVEAAHLVGQMALMANTDGRKIELVRCSNSLSAWYSKIAKSLTDARKADEPPVFDRDGIEQLRCPQCGRLLPEKGSFCPACLKKRQVLVRVWSYMRPYWPKALLIMLCIMAGTATSLAPPILLKVLVDDVLGGSGGSAMLLTIVVGLVMLRVVSTVIGIFRGRMSAWLGSRDAVQELGDGELLFPDVDGNRYRIVDWRLLDLHSERLLEHVV